MIKTFSSVITKVPIFGEDNCSDLFPHVATLFPYKAPYDDITIEAVVKAIVEPRLVDKEEVVFVNYSPDYTGTMYIVQNTLNIISCSNDLKGSITNMVEGLGMWNEKTDLEKFILNNLGSNIIVYTNEELNSAIVCGDLDSKVIHAIAFFVPRFFKKQFETQPPTEEEMAILKALLGDSPDDFLMELKRLARRTGLETKSNGSRIAGAMKTFRQTQYNNALEAYNGLVEMVDDRFESYKLALKDKHDAELRVEGARALLNKDDDNEELIEFMCENPKIEIISIGDDAINLVIDACLDIYDADGFEEYTDRFLSSIASPFGDDDTKLLLRNVFSADPLFRVRTCGYYSLNMYGYVTSARGYRYSGRSDRIPNPHLQYHNCLGNNQADIQEFMRKGNMIGAIMQCISSCMSINIHEVGPTFKPFCEELMSKRTKVLELVDSGEQFTPAEAIAYLKEKKEGEAEE